MTATDTPSADTDTVQEFDLNPDLNPYIKQDLWYKKPGVDLGLLPTFIDTSNPTPAKLQIHKNYAHGGGWNEFKGFTLDLNKPIEDLVLEYPDDPPMRLLAFTLHPSTRELVLLFEYSWVAIVQLNGDFEVARID